MSSSWAQSTENAMLESSYERHSEPELTVDLRVLFSGKWAPWISRVCFWVGGHFVSVWYAMFKGLNCGCVLVLSTWTALAAASLFKVCRDSSPDEQEKAHGQTSVNSWWRKECSEKSHFLLLLRFLFSNPWKPSEVFWLAQLLVQLHSSGRGRITQKNVCSRYLGERSEQWKNALISLREQLNTWADNLALIRNFVSRVCLAEKDRIVSLYSQTS